MNCPNCGAETMSQAKFCVNCGSPLQAAAPVADQVAAPQQPAPAAPQAQQPASADDIFATYEPTVQPESPMQPVGGDAPSMQSQVFTPAPAYNQPQYQPAVPGAIYPMSDSDRTLRLIAFIFCIVSLACSCWLLIPLAWMIPMTVISWGIYKGQKRNTVAFGVCMLLFCSIVSGILLLCSHKDD